jgi:hypothetical protein
MKGVIFNVFENFIVETFDEESWEAVLDDNDSDGVFVSPKTYDDQTFMNLVTSAITLKNLVPGDAIRLFGKYLLPVLMKNGGDLVSHYTNSLELLLELDSIIHVEVRKLMDGAEPPKFTVKQLDDTTVSIHYQSKRNLPDLVEGLIEGSAAFFGELVSYKREENSDGTFTFYASFTRQ